MISLEKTGINLKWKINHRETERSRGLSKRGREKEEEEEEEQEKKGGEMEKEKKWVLKNTKWKEKASLVLERLRTTTGYWESPEKGPK